MKVGLKEENKFTFLYLGMKIKNSVMILYPQCLGYGNNNPRLIAFFRVKLLNKKRVERPFDYFFGGLHPQPFVTFIALEFLEVVIYS